MIIYADDSDFSEKVLRSGDKMLLDFFAEWCLPCREIAPVIDEISQNYKVCKIDVDNAPRTARAYNINSVPTLLVMQNGVMGKHHIGYANKMKY